MKQHRVVPVYRSLLVSFIELFHKNNRGQSSFPYRLGKYTFVKHLYPETRPNPYYHYGLYKDKKNTKYFVKQWIGKNKMWSLGAIMLYQEIQTNLLFKKLSQNTTSKVLPISDVFENELQIFIVYPYLKFSDFTKASTQEKYIAYQHAFNFLKTASLAIKNISILSTRKPRMYVFQYMLFFMRSISLHPQERANLIKSLILFFKGYTDLRNTKLSLAHRDLHLGNILRVNNKQYLTDFALTTRTVEHYDLIRSYLYNVQDKKLAEKLISDINTLIKNGTISKNYAQSLTVFMITHLLSVSILSKEIHDRFKACLTAVINDEVFSDDEIPQKSSLMVKFISIISDRIVFTANPTSNKRPFTTTKHKQTIDKTWSMSQRDLHYFDLLQEIIIYSLFSKYKKLLIKTNNNVLLPKLINYKKTNKSILLKTAYINSQKSSLPFTERFKVITKFLGDFTSVLTEEEKNLIGKKGLVRSILVSPLSAIVASIRFPRLTGVMMSSFVTAFVTMPWVYKNSTLSIVHGDLHPENIITNKNEIYLIDFEQTHITSHLFEVATSITSTKLSVQDQEEFRYFVKQSFTPSEKIAIASLSYFNLLETIAHVQDEKKVSLYIDRIRFINQLLFSLIPQISYVKGGLL